MSRTTKELEFFRQQRRLASAVESSSLKAITTLVTIQFLEQKLKSVEPGSSKAPSLKRAIVANRKTLQSAASEHYDEIGKLVKQLESYCNTQEPVEAC
jgi:uncharacterized coiled-coil DUF342 family protein